MGVWDMTAFSTVRRLATLAEYETQDPVTTLDADWWTQHYVRRLVLAAGYHPLETEILRMFVRYHGFGVISQRAVPDRGNPLLGIYSPPCLWY